MNYELLMLDYAALVCFIMSLMLSTETSAGFYNIVFYC